MGRRGKSSRPAPRAKIAAGPRPAQTNTRATAVTGAGTSRRWPAIDLYRGCAILAMIVYHFCFDLTLNGWLVVNFGEDLRWVWFRFLIVSSFLVIAGASLALAEARGQTATQFWRRVAVIAGAAALVTLGTYVTRPEMFIYFGVLHAIALMTVLARPVLKWGAWTILPGLAVLVIGITVQHPFFDQPPLHWIGMMTFKPATADYVPLFPWFGMVLIGAGIGAWATRHPAWPGRLAAWTVPRRLGWIAWLGRHSLAVYLLHQPLLLGAMLMVRQVL